MRWPRSASSITTTTSTVLKPHTGSGNSRHSLHHNISSTNNNNNNRNAVPSPSTLGKLIGILRLLIRLNKGLLLRTSIVGGGLLALVAIYKIVKRGSRIVQNRSARLRHHHHGGGFHSNTAYDGGEEYEDEYDEENDNSVYDVCIVGAGPSGATCAYYLAQAGKRVLILERRKFPRDKICGNAVTYLAQKRLEEMGILQELLAEGKACIADRGGIVSPGGISYIGEPASSSSSSSNNNNNNDNGNNNKNMKAVERTVMAIKRIHLDEKIVRAAIRAGATLEEEHPVSDARFSPVDNVWTIETATEDGIKIRNFKARVLVCADGAPSTLARKLRIVKTEPNAVCSRAFVEAGTHKFDADGVIVYNYQGLPGFSALFRNPNDEIGLYTFVAPGGVTRSEDVADLHNHVLRDPFVSRALGPGHKIGELKWASIRLGGIQKSHADNCLVIGDAAGHVDPLTGEGIQFAMEGAKIAADVLVEGLDRGDLSEAFLQRYQNRWMKAFGHEFYWSWKISYAIFRYPIILDALASIIQKKGYNYMMEWALVMTGAKSKLWFLRPDVTFLLVMKIAQLYITRGIKLLKAGSSSNSNSSSNHNYNNSTSPTNKRERRGSSI